MRRGRIFAVLVAAMLAGWPLTVAGQSEEDIRWVDLQGSSSNCIGSPDSAICAVEMALACRVRRDAALCGAVGLALPREEELPFTRRNPDPFAIVEATGVKYLIHDEEQGDSRRIGVSVRFHGKYGLNWPDRGWRRLVYGVRRAGGGWLVDDISWQPWIRMIGPRDATSECIGMRDAPACALETHIACRVRGDAALCTDTGGLEPKHFRPNGATVLYYIDRIRKWEPPELPVPDSIFVVVWVAESNDLPLPGILGSPSFHLTRPNFMVVSYTLERLRGQWRVVNRTERP
jgi:hypothetical protein